MSAQFKYHYFSYQISGQRPLQEDAVLIKPERSVFALSDGFGGFTDSGSASIGSLACQSVAEFIENKMGDTEATLPFEIRKYFTLGGNIIFNSLLYANETLMKFNEGKALNERGGASLCAGYLYQGRLSLGNCGSCQGFIVRNGVKTEIIQPRSYRKFMLSGFSQNDEKESDDFPLVALGVFPDMQAEVTEYSLEAEDVLVFYTQTIGTKLNSFFSDYQLNKFNHAELFSNLTQKIKEFEPQTHSNSSILLIKVSV